MVGISKADIEKKAKELCERDGYSWDVPTTRPQFQHALKRGIPVPTEAMRETYLNRAEQALLQQRRE